MRKMWILWVLPLMIMADVASGSDMGITRWDDSKAIKETSLIKRHEFTHSGFYPIIEANLGSAYYKYEEPDLMNISGLIMTAHIRLGVFVDSFGLMVRYNTTIGDKFNSLKYNGGYIGSGIPINDLDDRTNFWSVDGVLGSRFTMANGAEVFTYGGYGYRSLNNDNQVRFDAPNNTYISGTKRRQEYHYILVSVDVREKLLSWLNLTQSVEARWMFLGKNLTQSNPNANPPGDIHKYKQKNDWGLRAQLGIEFDVATKFFVQIYADYWKVKESSKVWETDVTYWIEPKNWTIQSGVEVGVRF